MKQQFTLLTLIIIAFIGIWGVIQAPEELPAVARDPHYVDAYIKDFTMLSMDEAGRPYYTLTADLMEHFNDTGASEITEPVFNREGFTGNRFVLLAIAILVVFQLGFTYLPGPQFLFGTTSIGPAVWLQILLVSSSVLFLVELEKYIVRQMNHRRRG